MSEKKVVGRRMFIALEIVCIILLACVVGATSLYQLQINDKDNTISSLNSQISQLNTNATSLRSQIDSLNLSITNLQSQVNNLTDILSLRKSTTLYNGTVTIVPPFELTMLDFNIPYAGYVLVKVSSPQINETVIIDVIWWIYPILRYQNDFNLGNNGTAIFPVLPPSFVVYFDDPQLTYNSTATGTETTNATITYCY
jgi:hypothetical protein